MMHPRIHGFQRGAAGPCAPAGRVACALTGRLARVVLPVRALSTLARGKAFRPERAIPGGRGGPKSVAPILPVGVRAVVCAAARAFRCRGWQWAG